MTSDEIREVIVECFEHPERITLWEIAYQLAVMNEREQKACKEYIRGVVDGQKMALGSPVHDPSQPEVRGNGITGFEPPPLKDWHPTAHLFQLVEGNRFCGYCGAGEYHPIHITDKRVGDAEWRAYRERFGSRFGSPHTATPESNG